MKLNMLAPTKNRAQAMVEFAIVLPILLLLLYGLLEAGRLLFMYSTIVTASRQAVRYGSATGDGTTPGVPRYQDCAGIRLAANKVDFLNAFDHTGIDITIAWDTGPGSTVNAICPTGVDSYNWTPPPGNSTRLIVTIAGHFNPVVPKIVPFIARIIEARSARTILTGVSIAVTPPGGSGGVPSANGLSLSITASQSTYSVAGETIYFTYTLTNNSNPPVDVSGPFTITDSFGSLTCPDNPLAPGATATCPQVAYVTTQADVDAQRSITDIATANNGTILSNQATATVTFAAQPALTLAKSASPQASAIVGQVITYTYTLTNTGNVTLNLPYTVSDDKIASQDISCPTSGVLPVGLSTTCTASYALKQPDINQKTLVNQATASAGFGTQTVTSNQATATVYTPALYLTADVSPTSVSQVGQVITFTYHIQNSSANPLVSPYSITNDFGGRAVAVNCGGAVSPLGTGANTTCTGTYTVTQADLDGGKTLVNSITASATESAGNKTTTSNTVSVSVGVVANPVLSMQITSVSPNPATALNTVITYVYTLTNSGNVTLSSPKITDTKVTNITCPASLAPGAVQNCTGTYTVTQADLDAGSIANQATASATFNSQPVSSASQSFTVLTYQGPRFRLQITPNPASFTGIGQFIVYTYTLANTGSVPLYGPYQVSDNKVTFVDCSAASSPLAIGASTTCVGSYATTQADIDGNYIDSSATANASDGTQTVTSNVATATVIRQGAPTRTPPATATSTPTATPTATATPAATATKPGGPKPTSTP